MRWLLFLAISTLIIYLREHQQLKNKDLVRQKHRAGKEQIKLNAEQLSLFNVIEHTNKHIFVTGKAGSGKSQLLRYFKTHTKKQAVITAPTGIAALGVNGQTIHSLFKLSQGLAQTPKPKLHKTTTEVLKRLEVLVIDEISMVRADLLDAVDQRLRLVRNSNQSFGGVQLVMFGDLYQLPPIVNPVLSKYFLSKYGGYFFFNALVWRKTDLEVYELSKAFRQASSKYKSILNEIRLGKVSQSTLATLNKRVTRSLPNEDVITLAATNKVVNQINHQRLAELPTKEYVYRAKVAGSFKTHEQLIDKDLKLKVGAQVMLTKNDLNKRWVNGSLGVVASLKKNGVRVRINRKVYSITQVNWHKIKYSYSAKTNQISEEQAAIITQYPLRLAWAVTIHKSQGQTYTRCAVDLKNGVFADGQAYVALSRCTSLSGLYLLSPILASDISVAPSVINFMSRVRIIRPPRVSRTRFKNR